MLVIVIMIATKDIHAAIMNVYIKVRAQAQLHQIIQMGPLF